MSDWISVKDRLPEEGAKVLIWKVYPSGSAMMYIAQYQFSYDGGGPAIFKELFGVMYNIKPTHWQPLPEPPKEEKQ